MSRRQPAPCIVTDCAGITNVPGTARGYCSKHYQRWQRYGNPFGQRQFRNTGKVCAFDGCSRGAVSRGYCGTHTSRVGRHGTTDDVRAFANAPAGTKWCPKCSSYQPTASFYRSKATRDGLMGECGSCARARRRDYARRNPERNRSTHRLRKVVRERFSRNEIFERDEWTCQLCGSQVERALKWPDRMSATIDHIRPLAKGGQHTRHNVQLAHLRCNCSKRHSVAV